MARRKNSGVMQMAMAGGSDSLNTDIAKAENGFIVSVSGQTSGKNPNFFHKKFIATSRPQATRIAASHLSALTKGGKKSGRKKSVSKR